MKKLIYCLLGFLFFAAMGFDQITFSSQPPFGHSGFQGINCTNCHGSFAANSGGGSVTVTGLPTTGYVPGQTYTFSVTIAHAVADRQRWGFTIQALNAANQAIGTFSSTNPNADLNGTELSHLNAVVTTPRSSYTYNNLRWTAPAAPGANDNIVGFYYAGAATNSNGNPGGDYIHTGSTLIALPITLSSFSATVKNNQVGLAWQTSSEINSQYFVVQRSSDAIHFDSIGTVRAAGMSSILLNYAFTDAWPPATGQKLYYRLAMTDLDASLKYSKVLSAMVKPSPYLITRIYPNAIQAGNTLNIDILGEKNADITIRLLNSAGTTISRKRVPVIQGQNTLRFPVLASLPAGTYYIEVITPKGTEQRMLYIQ